MPQNHISQHQLFVLYQWTLHVSCFSDWSRRLRFALTRLCFREAYSNPTCIFVIFKIVLTRTIFPSLYRRSNFRFSDHATGLSSTTHWFGYIAAARRGYAGCFSVMTNISWAEIFLKFPEIDHISQISWNRPHFLRKFIKFLAISSNFSLKSAIFWSENFLRSIIFWPGNFLGNVNWDSHKQKLYDVVCPLVAPDAEHKA